MGQGEGPHPTDTDGHPGQPQSPRTAWTQPAKALGVSPRSQRRVARNRGRPGALRGRRLPVSRCSHDCTIAGEAFCTTGPFGRARARCTRDRRRHHRADSAYNRCHPSNDGRIKVAPPTPRDVTRPSRATYCTIRREARETISSGARGYSTRQPRNHGQARSTTGSQQSLSLRSLPAL